MKATHKSRITEENKARIDELMKELILVAHLAIEFTDEERMNYYYCGGEVPVTYGDIENEIIHSYHRVQAERRNKFSDEE